MVFFSFGWTPLQALYPAEVLRYENRAKGLALQGWCTSAFSLINTFGLPSALAALDWKSEHKALLLDASLLLTSNASLPHLHVLGRRWRRYHLHLCRGNEAARFGGYGRDL